MNFHLVKDDQQLGPYSLEEMKDLLLQGLVLTTDLVLAEGHSSWETVDKVAELAVEPPASRNPAAPSGQQIKVVSPNLALSS